jgi:hypothetical protein
VNTQGAEAVRKILDAYPARRLAYSPEQWEGYRAHPPTLEFHRSILRGEPERLDRFAVEVCEQIAYSYPNQPLALRGHMETPSRIVAKATALAELMDRIKYPGPPSEYIRGSELALHLSEDLWRGDLSAIPRATVSENFLALGDAGHRGVAYFLDHESRIWERQRHDAHSSMTLSPEHELFFKNPFSHAQKVLERARGRSGAPIVSAINDLARTEFPREPGRSGRKPENPAARPRNERIQSTKPQNPGRRL